MDEMLAIVLGVSLAGAAGGFALARYVRGGMAVVGCLGWLVLPFVLLGASILFTVSQDAHHATAEHARADAMQGFAIISLFAAPVWFGASFVGWLIGRFVSKRQEK